MPLETLCKLYLELANVVPEDCRSKRELRLQHHIDSYGIALMMISEGCADPVGVAKAAIEKMSH
jgi:hypothetical protein